MILTTRAAGLAILASLLLPTSAVNGLQPEPATAQGTDCSSCSYPGPSSSRPNRPPGNNNQYGGSGANAAQTLGVILGTMRQLQDLYSEDGERERRMQEEQRRLRERQTQPTWAPIAHSIKVQSGSSTDAKAAAELNRCAGSGQRYGGIADNRIANCPISQVGAVASQSTRAAPASSNKGAKFCGIIGRNAGNAVISGMGIHSTSVEAACLVATDQPMTTTVLFRNGTYTDTVGNPLHDIQFLKCENGGWFGWAHSGAWRNGRFYPEGSAMVCGKASRKDAENAAMAECAKDGKACHLYVTGLNEGKLCDGRPYEAKAGSMPRVMGTFARAYNDDGSFSDCVF